MARKIAALFFASAIIFAGMFCLAGCGVNGTGMTYQYGKRAEVVSFVRIMGAERPHVRAEPIATDREENNSYGAVIAEGDFSLEVPYVYIMDEPIDKANGTFVGLRVRDILETAEGRSWFPDLGWDPDGIVWINHRYITVIY